MWARSVAIVASTRLGYFPATPRPFFRMCPKFAFLNETHGTAQEPNSAGLCISSNFDSPSRSCAAKFFSSCTSGSRISLFENLLSFWRSKPLESPDAATMMAYGWRARGGGLSRGTAWL